MKKCISALHIYHSQHRLDIMNLLDEEYSQLKSTVNIIEEKIREFRINGDLNHISPQRDMTLQESDCRNVHINPGAGSDIITKENLTRLPNTSTSEAGDASESFAQDNLSGLPNTSTSGAGEALTQAIKEKENLSVMPKTPTSGTGDASEALAQALQEKVAALLLLSQQEERYLLESNVNAALQKKVEELQRNLIQVTNEKVFALMELVQLKQKHRLLQEKVNEDVKQGKILEDSREKSIVQDKDGRLKNLLKKTYFKHWINPLDSHESEAGLHQENAQSIGDKRSSTSTNMDFARMKVEYAVLKEILEGMEHLTSSVHRLRLSLVKVKESIASEDTVTRKPETIENVGTEAKLLRTAFGRSLPVSWFAESDPLSGKHFNEDSGDSSFNKFDCVSAAGFEMVELLIFASQLLMDAVS